MNVLPYQEINFDPIEHKYWDFRNREYISVTTLIGQEHPFDADEIASNVIINPRSKYYGMVKEDVLQLWEESGPHGTVVHDAIENYIKHNKKPDEPHLIPLINQFKKLNFRGHVWSEIILHSEEYLIAGMADIVEELPDICYLYDIKTSVSSPKGDLASFKLEKFTLQLNMYKYLIQKLFNKPCKVMAVFWFADYVNQKEKTKMKVIPIEDNLKLIEGLLHSRKVELIGR